jgi:diguanylate cyclase (GGDEF)-like protein
MPYISMRTKLITSAVAMLLLLGGISIFFIETALPDTLRKELQKRAIALARDVAEDNIDNILYENIIGLELDLHRLVRAEEDIEYVFIQDRDGNMIAHTFGDSFPVDLKEVNAVGQGDYNGLYLPTEQGEILDLALPVLDGELGTIRIGISTEPVSRDVRRISRMTGVIILGVILMGTGMVVFGASLLTRPVSELTNAVRKIGEGDLDSHISVYSNDEMGRLAQAFNEMTGALKGTTVRRDELEREVIKRKQVEEELRALSLTDELTGLYNRRGFFTLAEKQLKLARRMERGLMLVYADLDGLKLINDGFGHEHGDILLVEIASLLKDVFRESDIIARIGGDEFVVLSMGADCDSEELVSDRIEKRADEYNAIREHVYRLSLSIGVLYFDWKGSLSIDELISQADQLMYRQKQRK